jgi:hypothetical protein
MIRTSRIALAFAFASLALAGAARAAEPKPNTLTKAEKKAGWKLLFDGKTTKGFRGYKEEAIPTAWKVVDGALTWDKKEGDTGGDIVTTEQFESFELALDWKISEGGNSGVMYHVQLSEKAPYMTGPEMQILDNKTHKDGGSPLTSAAACYALYPPAKDVTKPVGEWNQARLVVAGSKVEHWLNGEKVVDFDYSRTEWKEAVERLRQRGGDLAARGAHLHLQDHGDPVWYRSIRLRTLEP